MNRNENKGTRQKLFFVFIIVAIVLAVILQMLWIPSVQQRILEFGESMIGRSLRRHEKWIGIMKMFAVFASILILTFPFCFYEFKIPSFSHRQEISLKNYICGGGI